MTGRFERPPDKEAPGCGGTPGAGGIQQRPRPDYLSGVPSAQVPARPRRRPSSASDRAWARYTAAHPHPSNDECRACDLLYLTVTDNGGGMYLIDMPDDWLLDVARLARQIRAELQALETEEAQRLRVVRR